MVGHRWLVAVAVLSGCVVRGPGFHGAVALRPVVPESSCGDRAISVRVQNPGPAPVMVGSVVLAPGWTALCVPVGAERIIATRMWSTAYGGPLAPVLTPDRQAAIGHPIEVVERGETYTTAVVDTRQALRVALAPDALGSGPPPSVAIAPPPPPVAIAPPPPPPSLGLPAQPPPPEAPAPLPEPVQVAYDGRYRLVSEIDLAGTQITGAAVSGMLVELSEFREHPTPVLLKVMRHSKIGYPAMENVWNVWDVLPDGVQRFTLGLVDKALVFVFDHIEDFGDIASLISELGDVSRRVQLETELTLGPSIGGAIGSSRHMLTRVGLRFRSHERWIAIPAELGRVTQVTDVQPSIEVAVGPAGRAMLRLGRQSFQLRYGALLFDELAATLFARAGTSDLGGWLTHVIDCRAFERELSRIPGIHRLVSGSALRGHCGSALTDLGTLIEQEVRSWSLELVDMAGGRCEMASRGGTQIDELTDGSWTMMIRVHGRDLQTSAPFGGVRVGP